MTKNWKIFVLLLMFRCCICEDESKKSYQYYKVFSLEGPVSDLREMIKYIQSIDKRATYEVGINQAHVLLHPNLVKRFKNFANNTELKVTEIISDYSKLLENEVKLSLRDREYNNTAYYDIGDINRYIASMQEAHPEWSHLVIGGESTQGRKIVGLRIMTNVPLPKNKPKPLVFIEGGIHAREWVSPASALFLINKLLTNKHPNVTLLRNSFEWHIFPVINPDGYHYSFTVDRLWRKSRAKFNGTECAGVDLNRNWSFDFGNNGMTFSPCDYQTYAGPNAFSEIETRSMARYISTLKNMIAFISFHSYAQCIIVPYASSSKSIEKFTELMRIANRGADYAFELNGDIYGVGKSSTFMGDLSGTSLDWVYSVKKPPIIMVIEIKGGTFQWPKHNIPEIGEEVSMMIVGIFEEARKQGLYSSALPYI